MAGGELAGDSGEYPFAGYCPGHISLAGTTKEEMAAALTLCQPVITEAGVAVVYNERNRAGLMVAALRLLDEADGDVDDSRAPEVRHMPLRVDENKAGFLLPVPAVHGCGALRIGFILQALDVPSNCTIRTHGVKGSPAHVAEVGEIVSQAGEVETEWDEALLAVPRLVLTTASPEELKWSKQAGLYAVQLDFDLKTSRLVFSGGVYRGRSEVSRPPILARPAAPQDTDTEFGADPQLPDKFGILGFMSEEQSPGGNDQDGEHGGRSAGSTLSTASLGRLSTALYIKLVAADTLGS